MSESLSDWRALETQIVSCRRCSRLVAWREEVARTRRRAYSAQEYWGCPVPGFGDVQARVLVVGLAPGAHGANRTGRMFTGDGSGDFLYSALYRAGFANQPSSRSRHDGMILQDAFISAACRCAPPDNRPSAEELAACLPYLRREILLLPQLQVIVPLGRIAFDAVGRVLGVRTARPTESGAASQGGLGWPRFAHGASWRPKEGLPCVVASYHPSRQNTQTGRLTADMFDTVWVQVRELLSG